ncbi:MAG: DUF805 domain-containing protein [Vicinamibacterales bacterium]
MHWYLQALGKYAVFTGRARRKEYWMFVLFNILIVFALGLLEGILGIAAETGESVLVTVYELGILVPAVAVGVRRMHDTDHSGWWLLVPIVNLVFAVSEGQHGDNRFGPDPKASVPESSVVSGAAHATGIPVPVKAEAASPAMNAFCTQCGTRLPDVAAYCPQCGAARAAW